MTTNKQLAREAEALGQTKFEGSDCYVVEALRATLTAITALHVWRLEAQSIAQKIKSC